MKCYICDRTMSPEEIQYIKEENTFDCCSVCLEVAKDAAYCDGFKPEPDPEEEEIEFEANMKEIELLILDEDSPMFSFEAYKEDEDEF